MSNRYCPECWAIQRELRDASLASAGETRRVVDDWLSSGREIREFYHAWLSSITEMFADDTAVQEWFKTQPKLVEARRRKAEHEVLSGHSVYLALNPSLR